MRLHTHGWLAAAFAAFMLQPALAQDATQDPLRILSDPAYLPLQGQFTGRTTYNYGWLSGGVYDASHAKLYGFHTDSNEFRQYFDYGLTDDLSLNVGMSYDPSVTQKRDYSGGTVEHLERQGFSDPSFGLTYRAVDQRTAPFNLDLYTNYQPDWIDAKAPSVGHDGSIARGGDLAQFGAALSHVTPGFTILGRFEADYNGDRSILQPASGLSSHEGSNWDYLLGLETQTRLNDRFSLDGNASYTFNGDSGIVSAGGVPHDWQPGNVTDLGVAVDYQMVPNRFVASLGYDYRIHDDTSNLFPGAPASDTSVKYKDENVLGVKLNYALN